MNIALIGNAPDTLIRFRSDLIRTFVSQGHKVYAFSPGYSVEQKEAVHELGAVPVSYSLERTGTNPFQELGLVAQYRKLFRQNDIELVFCYFVKPVIYGSLAARSMGIKRIYGMLGGLGYLYTDDPEAGDFLKRRVLRGVATPLFKIALASNKKVFFQNPDDCSEFIKRNLVAKEKTVRLYGSGVNLEQFPQTDPVQTPVTFITTGRLLAEKGFREYYRAAKEVKESHPDARFILLGGPDENPGGLTKSEVRSWADEGVIEWPGRVSDVGKWLNESSVFVLPSYREGTPRSTLEAMSIGRAVITTDVPGCRETVQHGINGFLVPPRDDKALAQSMMRFIENPAFIKTMGKKSRNMAEELYDVRKVNQVMLREMELL